MAVQTQAPESKFVYVIVAARRARQLQAGARPLVDYPKSHKATRIAQEELDKGLLEYQLPQTPEEIERDGKRRKQST